jgi:hypothetical protein
MKRVFLLLIVLITALGLGSCTKQQARAIGTYAGGIDAAYMETTGRKQIEGYKYFYDQYAICKSWAANLKVLDPEVDAIEYKGLFMNLNQAIEDYNSKSNQDFSTGAWRAADLPAQISLATFGL